MKCREYNTRVSADFRTWFGEQILDHDLSVTALSHLLDVYDATTGKILWETRLPTSAQGFPITYLAKGKQYVAMPAGWGGGSWSTLIPTELAPDIRRPNRGNVLMVFALRQN